MNFEPLLIILFIMLVLAIAAGWLIRSMQINRIRKETPPQDTVNLPFPQQSPYVDDFIRPQNISPEALTTAVKEAYAAWLMSFMLPDVEPGRAFLRMGIDKRLLKYRVTATSIGQGQAMAISTLMGGSDVQAQARFNRLLAFCDAHPSANSAHLMSWQVIPDDAINRPLDSVTHGDIWIAYALLMANQQWGSAGKINYIAIARKILLALEEQCIHAEMAYVLRSNGLSADDPLAYGSTRSIDCLPFTFDAFHSASANPLWERTSQTMLQLIEKEAQRLNGLMDMHIQIDSNQQETLDNDQVFDSETATLLLNLSLSCLLTPEGHAFDILKKIYERIKNLSDNDVANIRSAYTLDGKPLGKEPAIGLLSSLAAAAFILKDQDWLDSLWKRISTHKPDRLDPAGETQRLLTLMLLSGNWWLVTF